MCLHSSLPISHGIGDVCALVALMLALQNAMASVEDIRLRENYLSWDKCREDTLVVKPELRDWERTNYQMDLRYVEWMMDHKPGDANKPVVSGLVSAI